jgi:hypothetical protein
MVENHLAVGGGVVFWTLPAWTDRGRLGAAFEPLGLAAHVPAPRPAAAVLRDALEDALGGPRVLVRPLAGRDGFAVVREHRGHTANGYTTDLVARVTAADPPGLAVDPPGGPAERVAEAFRRHAGRVPAAQLSAALVRVVEALGGTRLRPGGAVYWVPSPRLADWAGVARAVEAAADGGRPAAVYLLRHRLDADAVRAVRDAVVAEVRAAAEQVRAEVATGELGGRALTARQQQAAELRAKVLLYEDLLAVGLADLHAAVDAADQAAAAAALLLSAEAHAPTAAAV